MTPEGIFTSLAAVLAVVVSVISANNSTSKQSFEQLQKVVRRLQKDLARERKIRIAYENWSRRLCELLAKHEIKYPALEINIDEDSRDEDEDEDKE